MLDIEHIKLQVNESAEVSGLFVMPRRAKAVFAFAHGAGAGLTHPFMEEVAQRLAELKIATLRFNFPFMETRGDKRWGRPDTAAVAQGTVRAALTEAQKRRPDLPLFAGGKSFGARMSSQMQAQEAFARLCGLIFIGFPLHPAKKPSTARADHLQSIAAPMLFVQGSRDALADVSLLRPVCATVHAATLHIIDGADHSFHVPASSGRKDAEVMAEICDVITAWVNTQIALSTGANRESL